MPRGRGAQRVPSHLGVKVGVNVHESWGDHEPVGIDLTTGSAFHPTHLGNAVAVDGDVRGDRRGARAVHHGPTADDEVECHCLPFQ